MKSGPPGAVQFSTVGVGPINGANKKGQAGNSSQNVDLYVSRYTQGLNGWVVRFHLYT